MFVARQLVYVENHKTGSTQILDLLGRAIPGRAMGKHNRPRKYPADRVIVTSVRNPWDWYLSLWTFGCRGLGAVHGRLTAAGLDDAPGSRAARWRELYADAGDPGRFRAWLQCMHDSANAGLLGEGYGDWPLNARTGFCTYRFLGFAVDDVLVLRDPGPAGGSAEALYARHNAIDRVIRTERLSTDLLAALEAAGCPPDDATTAMIRGGDAHPTNASARGATTRYYDADTARLVGDRERLLVEAFDYQQPDV